MLTSSSELIHSGSLWRQEEKWEVLHSDVWDELYRRNACFFLTTLKRACWDWPAVADASYTNNLCLVAMISEKWRWALPTSQWFPYGTCKGALQNCLQTQGLGVCCKHPSRSKTLLPYRKQHKQEDMCQSGSAKHSQDGVGFTLRLNIQDPVLKWFSWMWRENHEKWSSTGDSQYGWGFHTKPSMLAE